MGFDLSQYETVAERLAQWLATTEQTAVETTMLSAPGADVCVFKATLYVAGVPEIGRAHVCARCAQHRGFHSGLFGRGKPLGQPFRHGFVLRQIKTHWTPPARGAPTPMTPPFCPQTGR